MSELPGIRFVRGRPKPEAKTPVWEPVATGTAVSFSAIPLRLRTLGLIIAAVVVVVGLLGTAVLIAADLIFEVGGSRRIIVLCGAVLALPTYLLLAAGLKRRTVACRVLFDGDQLQIERGTSHRVVALADIDRLIWSCDSDYARFALRGRGFDVSLIAGMARMPSRVLPQLPPLSEQTIARLTASGLIKQQTRRAGLAVFSRVRAGVDHSDDGARVRG